MGLGTSDTASSLAFVIIPPGNIAKNIADIRMRLWTLRGAASARAYFDFPVLAWMGSPIDGAALAGIASRTTMPLELAGPERHNDDIFMRFNERHADDIANITTRLPPASEHSEYVPGPFEAGLGCFCARIPFGSDNIKKDDSSMLIEKIRATTFLLALVELRWIRGSDFSSSWATLSSARSGRRRS
ncbi:MAG: hypothetical protein RBT62_01635 [Spirochaetia bacterium]|nr:hypothetical protein [Spirochaetia bacterium]